MKEMKTTEAAGQVLCHDVNRIIRGVTKDAVFQKGHIIREEDIPVLLSMGKDSVYIWEKDEGMLHVRSRRRLPPTGHCLERVLMSCSFADLTG